MRANLVLFMMLIGLIGVDALSAIQEDLVVLSPQVFKIRPEASVKDDCAYAAQVIKTYSRPHRGYTLDSRCQYEPGLKDYVVRTRLYWESETKAGQFAKESSWVGYRYERSALYAYRLLNELNFKKGQSLLTPRRVGSRVELETLSMVHNVSKNQHLSR